MTLSIVGAALGLLGLILGVIAVRDARSAHARCRDVESHLESIRRQFEPLLESGTKTGRPDDCSAPQPLTQAIDSARLGATPGTISRRFGLSRLEAELVSRLHFRNK
jgi:hypothetical protein